MCDGVGAKLIDVALVREPFKGVLLRLRTLFNLVVEIG